MRRIQRYGSHALVAGVSLAALVAAARCSTSPSTGTPAPTSTGTSTSQANNSNKPANNNAQLLHDPVVESALTMIEAGRHTFRYDTFGDEAFWGGSLKLHQAIEGVKHGGVGGGVSPKTAIAVGLKVDVDALPQSVIAALRANQVDLDSADTTLALLKANAVVGVTGTFDAAGNMTTIGIQCALCHSTVDDSFAPSIGHRLDGWANRDLDVGLIVNLSPDLSAIDNLLGAPDATVRTVLQAWGPGKFDAELVLDGKALRPDGKSGATLIPPAFGLAGVNLHTWTGWGSVPYWNAFVANLEMHGQGTFFDPRLNDATQFPVAAKAGFGNVRPQGDDLITSKLPALQFYQLAIVAPTPAPSTFDQAAAERGDALFEGKAKCGSCHVDPLYTEPGWAMHTAAELGIDDFQSSRAPDKRYRTPPLKGLFTHMKGGFYHDGRFATLGDVVDHYDQTMTLGLTQPEKSDLVEYLKSL
jgi:hypothetical protein